MIYTGIGHHKRHSVACTLDAQGHPLHEARIDGNTCLPVLTFRASPARGGAFGWRA